jgi:acyl-[acyl-carrier-protein]-phospholipid O-acyltransferase/long-chain-fatty-acid--[acyl-carrier-protein] ligase
MSNAIDGNLGMKIFQSLRSRPFRIFLIDYGLPGKRIFSRGVVLSLSLLLSRRIADQVVGQRVGVLLPPGLPGFVANFALFLCGRVPVNLNFTLGPEINREILSSSGVETVLSASAMKKKFPHFPWPENCFWVDEFLREIACKRWLVLQTCLLAWIFPKRVVRQFQIPSMGGVQIATLLFTSGSSGKPKGVPLSHRNLITNCRQLHDLELFREQPRVLANLPLFHSFGMTVGMIFPTLRGLPVVTTPSPLDHRLNIQAISEQKVEILLGTPTFLRGYLKMAKHGDLDSIRYIVAGAEKSPVSFRKRWEEKINCQYLEGYGLTETSPALSFNLPGGGKRCGSVGRLLQGVECCTIDPESHTETDREQGGILCFRGANIFSGYWGNEEKTMEVLDEDGWFKTGDLGRLDRDGFLWIEGRVSRFSKIGGEMVPHGRVEEEIIAVLGLCPSDEPILVVSAMQDEKKGEKLVVLCSQPVDQARVRNGLIRKGISNLWIPRHFIEVDKIPLLPSGKTDWEKIRHFMVRESERQEACGGNQ